MKKGKSKIMIKVVKFGGSSLANGTQLQKVLGIMQSDKSRRIMIVSAPGKRSKEDEKVTDMLIRFAEQVRNDMDYKEIHQAILARYADMAVDLQMNPAVMEQIERHFSRLLRTEFRTPELQMEAFKASGEDCNARLVAAFLEENGLPARYMSPNDAGIYVTSAPGNARLLPESYNFLKQLNNMDGLIVIPGFFGFNEREEIITFSRGGSDISGAIVAHGVNADVYENFTDVDAIYAANPAHVPQPQKIEHLTYREMRELSYSGFSVFHDEALLPAFSAGIPVHVKNTNNPEAPGTVITRTRPKSPRILSGIASSGGFLSIYVSKYLMNREVGFIRKTAQIFEDLGLNIHHIPSGIDELTILVRRSDLTPGKQAALLYRLQTELQAEDVHIESHVCLVMLVGEGMVSSVGTTAHATAALARANINLEMINQGSSEISMMFGIPDADEAKAVRVLYDAFFGEEDSEQERN